MYTAYSITLSGPSESCVLEYAIQNHEIAQAWASLMTQVSPAQLRETLNPWQNFGITELDKRIARLEELIDELNSWLPEDNIIRKKWDYNNHQESVNRLHVHFPEQEKNERDEARRRQLSEYNDLIHEIEGMTHSSTKHRPYLLLCPDGLTEVALTDFTRFRAQRHFGELCLHYCHVGRHPFELYSAGDLYCPSEQIIPQHAINTYHTLRFYDDDFLEHWHKQKFKQFYNRSTLKSVIAFDDPKIAFGYITLGNLVKVNNSVDFTKDFAYNLVRVCDKVERWEISKDKI